MTTKNRLFDAGNGILVDFQAGLVPGVYAGTLNGETVAVKMVSPGGSEFSRKEREIENMIKLDSNANTVQYKASSATESPPNCYIAMEMCRRDTLENAVTEKKLMPEEKKLVMQHIANGLQHMHQQKVVHAKLEPRHILQSLDGKNAKICGFALSRMRGKSFSLSNRSIGEWGSPEVQQKKEVNEKSDVYSTGLIFQYILSDGKQPFGDESYAEKYDKDAKMNFEEYPLGSLASNLIQPMLSDKSEDRPTVEHILKHPFFWEKNRQDGCAEIVKKFLSAKDLERMFPDCKSELDGALLLYSLWHSEGQNLDIPDTLRQGFDEMIRPGLPKYRKLVNVKFGSREIPTRETPSVNTDTGRAVGEAQYLRDEIDTEACIIEAKKPYKRGKPVFPAKMKGVVADPAAVKIMPNTEEIRRSLELLQNTKDHENIVGVKRIFEIKTNGSIPGLDLRPRETAICVAMEPCDKSLTDILESNPSPQYRKMLALHLMHMLDSLQEKEICHGGITTDKLMLSKDKRNVKLLGSRKSVQVTDLAALHGDIRAAADVMKTIVGRESEQPNRILDVELFDDLYEKMTDGDSASKIMIHPFFWKPNKKLDFLTAAGNLFDARDGNKALEERIRGCCADDWSETLVLTAEEKQLWFSTDDDGIVYQKATAMKNRSTRKYDTTSRAWLVRFIRNCANHLLDDCEKERKDNGYTKPQKLFCTPTDIWKFFVSRYPKLLLLLYTFILGDSELRNTHRFARYFTEAAEKKALDKVK